MTLKHYWDDLYLQPDSSPFALSDISMIMLPLFLEMDELVGNNQIPGTHPEAMQRLVTWMLFGRIYYVQAMGNKPVEEDQSALLNGIRTAFQGVVELGPSMFRRPPDASDLHNFRAHLIQLGLPSKRLLPLPLDWL